MHTAALPTSRPEFPAMMATLCSYERHFGPHHPLTVSLMAQLALACWRAGESDFALPLLRKSALDLARHVGRENELRIAVLASLRDLLLSRAEGREAGAVQREFLECQALRLGADHPETRAAQASLAAILMESAA